MPEHYRPLIPVILVLVTIILLLSPISAIHAGEGIDTYYIRYDIKSSKNRIIKDNLLMVPAKNDFRGEKFSHFSLTGVISAAPGESPPSMERRIKDNAIKQLLVSHGLKSVKTKDNDTVISYEGLIITPLNFIKQTYHEKKNQYGYEVQIEFSAIAFPDQWKLLKVKHKIRQVFDDFFQLFQ